MAFRLVGNGGNCGGCEWVAAEGIITADTPNRLREYLAEYQSGYFVFNSPGGNLIAGLEMGIMLRAAKAGTSVGRTIAEPEWEHVYSRDAGRCASACAFAFLGGVQRDVEADQLGIHQFYNDVSIEKPRETIYSALDLSVTQITSALLINYAFDMGVDPRFISKASSICQLISIF